ncbi:MAG: hypothetical protein IJ722_07315 [Alloprevotella sp.]|nr:hypothetical protein [Alloprevotella sp.]
MQGNTLRHRIVRSTLTLPVTIAVGAAVWMAPDPADIQLWGGLAVALIQTFMLMELTNRNQLLRIRSRMVSTTYMALATACPFLHRIGWECVPPVCFAAAYFLLFATYQRERPEADAFHAFLLLAVGSFFFPPMILLGVLYFLSMLVQLRSLTWRTFTAGIFGILLPAAFYAAWVIGRQETATALDFLQPYLHPTMPDYTAIPVWQLVNAGFLALLALLGLLHYYRTNFNDKIRVRMCYYAIIMQEVALLAALCLLPEHFTQVFALLILNSAPLLGHYFALARGGRWMTVWFLFWIISLVGLGLYNYGLLPSLPQ